MNLNPTEIAIYGSAFTLIGCVLGHYLTHQRDLDGRKAILGKEADIRRRCFRKFLHTFRGRMERVQHTDESAVWAEYTRLAPEFKGEAALVVGDFGDIEVFKRLVDTLGNWRHQDVKKEAENRKTHMRDVICDSIDALIKFAESA